MKGQTNEIMNIVILSVFAIVLFILSYFITSSSQKTSLNILEKQYKYDIGKNSIYGFYYNRITGTETSYVMLLGYRELNGNPIFLGEFYPFIDVDEMITQYFTKYFGDNWYFEMGGMSLGNKKHTSFQSIEVLIPVPSQNNIIERGYLYVWSE